MEKQNDLTMQIRQIQEQVNEDFTESLLKLSYKYLDQYYLQVRQQANRSFLITLIFALLGGAVLIAGVIGVLFFELSNSGYVAVAAGLITNFITAVAFYLYNKTVASMRAYHSRLVLAQNLAIAIRAAELLPDTERAGQLSLIIQQLIQDYNKHLFSGDSEESEEKAHD